MRKAEQNLYVHVPYCDGKCIYCGFYSEIYEASAAEKYIEAVGMEFDLHFAGRKPSPGTIYFGGGTPSILSERLLARLCNTVRERVSTGDIREWTVEANPGTLQKAKLGMLVNSGVNRISIGVQSFDERVLKEIGRRHSVEDIGQTVRAVRQSGISNVGLDLIACLPGVDGKIWRQTLSEALELEPDHISVYALSVENETRLEKQVRKGIIAMPDDDAVLEALDLAETVLAAEGYGRYEISNFARPGRECLHNLSFWRGGDYLGFGPSASSRDGLSRRTNRDEVSRYISALTAGVMPPCEEETLLPETDIVERVVFAFRLDEGVDLEEWSLSGSGEGMAGRWESVLEHMAGDGLVELRDGRWRLTSRGRALADHVAVELMAAS